jgi:hypothetical protein
MGKLNYLLLLFSSKHMLRAVPARSNTWPIGRHRVGVPGSIGAAGLRGLAVKPIV